MATAIEAVENFNHVESAREFPEWFRVLMLPSKRRFSRRDRNWLNSHLQTRAMQLQHFSESNWARIKVEFGVRLIDATLEVAYDMLPVPEPYYWQWVVSAATSSKAALYENTFASELSLLVTKATLAMSGRWLTADGPPSQVALKVSQCAEDILQAADWAAFGLGWVSVLNILFQCIDREV